MDNDMTTDTTDTTSGLTLKIVQDLDPLNPRKEWENLGTMALFHKRYDLGDKGHGLYTSDFDGWDAMEDHLYRKCDAVVVLPVYMYDHSGITINTTGFHCPWDSGQIGFIFVTKAKARECFQWKRITQKRIGVLIDALKGEVETYDQYLTGDVWGYVIEDKDGNHVDSCFGYFGYKYATEEAKDILAACEKQLARQAA